MKTLFAYLDLRDPRCWRLLFILALGAAAWEVVVRFA